MAKYFPVKVLLLIKRPSFHHFTVAETKLANLEREIRSLKSELDHLKKCKLVFCPQGVLGSPLFIVRSRFCGGWQGFLFMNTYLIPWPMLGRHSLTVGVHSVLPLALLVGIRPISFTGEEQLVQER